MQYYRRSYATERNTVPDSWKRTSMHNNIGECQKTTVHAYKRNVAANVATSVAIKNIRESVCVILYIFVLILTSIFPDE